MCQKGDSSWNRSELSRYLTEKTFLKKNKRIVFWKEGKALKGGSGLVRMKNVIMGCIHQPRRQVPFIWKEVLEANQS